MKVFVSHDFDNKPEFENLVEWLAQAGVPYWDPLEVKPGGSLREQLREAIAQCAVCVFVATRKSVESSWCGAELGAFWGAGKPIIVYLAEASVTEEQLPPIVRGDVWERKISRIAARAKELVAQTTTASISAGAGSTRVGNLTVEQLEKVIQGALSLAAATGKLEGSAVNAEAIGQAARGSAGRVLEAVRAAERIVERPGHAWRRHILWVDDRPDNNIYERGALESLGIEFTLALSTAEALDMLSKRRFAAIISDMGRREGPREGYVLLEAVRKSDPYTPYFIYAGSNAPAHKREAAAGGAQGTTNVPEELFDMVVRALPENTVA
jgi:CheY-like chemotaxis protein